MAWAATASAADTCELASCATASGAAARLSAGLAQPSLRTPVRPAGVKALILGRDGKALAPAPFAIPGDVVRQMVEAGRVVEAAPVNPASIPGVDEGPPAVLGPVTRSAPGVPEALNDVMLSSAHYAFVTQFRFNVSGGATNGPTDFIATRFFPTQVAKQVPFSVRAAWMMVDDAYSWSTNWQLDVVLESDAQPFVPDRTRSLGSATLDVSTIYPTRSPGITSVKYARAPLTPVTDYESAGGRFDIADGAHDDLFNRADEDLENPASLWVECSALDCAPTSLNLGVTGSRVVVRGPGSSLGWHFPDQTVGDCDPDPTAAGGCLRYAHDYIDALIPFTPDDDVRLSMAYDLTGAGQRVGVFARANLDRINGRLTDYYSAYLDQAAGGRVVIAANQHDGTGAPIETVRASTPMTIPDTGTLRVEIEGRNPVQIRVFLGAAPVPVLAHSETTFLFNGDPPDTDIIGWLSATGPPVNIGLGNIFGLAFPNAAGGEAADDFRTERHADLFVVTQLPDGEDAVMLGDASEESREFVNLFYTADGTAWGQALGISADPDCTRSWNSMVGLEVTDPAGAPGAGNSLFQINGTLASVHLSCCTCPTLPFECGAAGSVKDGCFPVSSWVGDTQPEFVVGEPIEIIPRWFADRAPTNATGAQGFFIWQVCNRADAASACSALCVSPTFANCGGLRFPYDSTGFRGVNDLATTDRDGDGFPDGVIRRFLQGTTPTTFTPPTAGDYTAFVWELYDASPIDGNIDSPTTDEFQANLFVTREFTVTDGTCTVAPYNLETNSLWMSKDDPGGIFNTCTPGQLWSLWAAIDPLRTDDEYNVHELVSRAIYVADRIGTPYPAPFGGTPLVSAATRPGACLNPAAASGDGLWHFGVFQADNCTGASLDDQP